MTIERFKNNWQPQMDSYARFNFNFDLKELVQQIREDAIDEFVELINTMPTYENEYGEIMPMPIKMMAEQLKEKKE